MRGRFPYQPLLKYPHLSKAEAEIWERFITMFPRFFDSVDYDVTVGDVRPTPEKLDAATERNRQYLGKWKIDVVAWLGDAATIIEIKKDADTKALGENWLYVKCFKAEHPDIKDVNEMILSDEERPNIRQCCDEAGVALIVV